MKPPRIDRLRARLERAEAWADDAKAAGSYQAAASLLKGAEAFDEKLAALEVEQKAQEQSDDPQAMVTAMLDEVAGLPELVKEALIAHLTGSIN